MTVGSFYKFHPKYGFWGKSNMSQEIMFNDLKLKESILINHNSLGIREGEINTKSNKRILCFGGSHTWGAGVKESDRYSNRLNEETNFEVFNFGHLSFGLDQICLFIVNDALKFKPDYIIIEQYPWVLHRVINNFVGQWMRPFFYFDKNNIMQLKKIPKFARFKFIRNILGKYITFKKEFNEYMSDIVTDGGIDGDLIDPLFVSWKQNYYKNMYMIIDNILSILNNYCRENHIKLIFAISAIKEEIYMTSKTHLIDYSLPRKNLNRLLNKNNIEKVDIANDMITLNKTSPVIFFDGHINAEGHGLFAEKIKEFLLKND